MTSRIKVGVAVALLGIALTACTQTKESADEGGSQGSTTKTGVHIGVVVHGATGDQFWSDVKDGVEDAAGETGSEVDYQSTADPDEQGRFIAAEVSKKVDAIVVSIPSVDALSGPIQAAEDAGVPVIVINSGANDWKDLGAVGFVGQDETVAGNVAGEAMKDAGVTKILCINITQVIQAVDDRCAGAEQGFGGAVETIRVDLGDAAGAVAAVSAKLAEDTSIDGVLSLGGGVYTTGRDAIKQSGSSAKYGTFDVNDDINAGLEDGGLLFALDQQPYIQGYQAVVMGALLASKNLLIGGGVAPILSGPRLLTPDSAS